MSLFFSMIGIYYSQDQLGAEFACMSGSASTPFPFALPRL